MKKTGYGIFCLRRYAWDSPTAAAGAVLGILMAFSSGVSSYMGVFDILGGLQNAYIIGLSAYIAPAVICFPHVMRFAEERAQGYGTFRMLRGSRMGYARRSLAEAMLSGGAVMLLAVAVYMLFVAAWCGTHGMVVTCNGDGFFGDAYNAMDTIYYGWVMSGMGAAVYAVNVLFLVFYAMFWSVAGTVISAFVSNRRVAVAAPFLFKRFLEYLIPDSLFFLLPSNLRMSAWVVDLPGGGIWYGFLYVGISFLIGLVVLLVKLLHEAVKG